MTDTSDARSRPPTMITVVKLGGELLETHDLLRRLADTMATMSSSQPLVVVHGGGREINRELELRGVASRTVDGLRITDATTLQVVVSVLAGLVNTRLVAAMAAAGARSVGLTGADDGLVTVEPAPPHRRSDGTLVDLELVGQPIDRGRPRLLEDLLHRGYVPVIASIGMMPNGRLLNVNADTLAAHIARRVGASRLLIAGATAGVLDASGATIDHLAARSIQGRIASGEVHGGMAAKLTACLDALDGGVAEVLVVDGRTADGLTTLRGTRIEHGAGHFGGSPSEAAAARSDA